MSTKQIYNATIFFDNFCLKTVHSLIVASIGIAKFSFHALHGRGHTLILSHPLHHNLWPNGHVLQILLSHPRSKISGSATVYM